MRRRKFEALLLITLFFAVVSSCSKKHTVDLTPSPIGDVVGKVVVGYQGWFAAIVKKG